MTPHEQLMDDPSLSWEEKLEHCCWRRTATPDQLERADVLTALWYSEKKAAERFQEEMTALVERKFNGP